MEGRGAYVSCSFGLYSLGLRGERNQAHQLAKDLEVHLHPHTSVEEIASEESLELEYKTYVHHDAVSKGLPLKLFECQPVVGKKARRNVLIMDGL